MIEQLRLTNSFSELILTVQQLKYEARLFFRGKHVNSRQQRFQVKLGWLDRTTVSLKKTRWHTNSVQALYSYTTRKDKNGELIHMPPSLIYTNA